MTRRGAAVPKTIVEQRLEIDGIVVRLARKRVKNINLRVRSTGEVTMSAPVWVSDAEVRSFVTSHEDWILDKIEAARAKRLSQPRRWADGETVLVWGEPMTLAIVSEPGRTRALVRRQGSMLVLVVSPALAGDDEKAREARKTLVERYWRHLLEKALPDVIARSESLVGEHANDWRLRRMKTRWGSCSVESRRIRLNVELASKPPECLDYVAIHELCHLIEPNHGPGFHALMDKFRPDWRDVRKTLNEAPPQG